MKYIVPVCLFSIAYSCTYAQSYSLVRTGQPSDIDLMQIDNGGNAAMKNYYYSGSSGVFTTFSTNLPQFRDLNNNGKALYYESWSEMGASRYSAFTFDGITQNYLASSNGEDPFGIRVADDGTVFGSTYRRVGNQALGRPTIFHTTGTTTHLPFLFNGSFSEGGIYGQLSANQFLGWSSVNSNYDSKVVIWTSGTPTVLNSFYGAVGNIQLSLFTEDGVPIFQNWTNSTDRVYTKFVGGQHLILDTGGLGPTSVKSDGTVVGTYTDINGSPHHGFYIPGIGVTDFSTLMTEHAPYTWDYRFFDRNSSGVFVGYTAAQGSQREVSFLIPESVPEPGTISILAGISLATLVQRRKVKTANDHK